MTSKASLLFVGLLVGAASLPISFAAADSLGGAGGTSWRIPAQPKDPVVRVANAGASTDAAAAAAQKKRKAAALKKKKQQAAAAKAKKAKALQAQQEQQKKKEWYADDRDRGLDVASKYAPNAIARVRERKYVAKGDTVNTGNGKKGWQQYMNKYYAR